MEQCFVWSNMATRRLLLTCLLRVMDGSHSLHLLLMLNVLLAPSLFGNLCLWYLLRQTFVLVEVGCQNLLTHILIIIIRVCRSRPSNPLLPFFLPNFFVLHCVRRKRTHRFSDIWSRPLSGQTWQKILLQQQTSTLFSSCTLAVSSEYIPTSILPAFTLTLFQDVIATISLSMPISYNMQRRNVCQLFSE